jgi:putative NADPH-quinone reductase
MMKKRILIIQGHPDPAAGRFCRALAGAYVRGARYAGSEIKRIEIAKLNFPVLRSRAEWQDKNPPEDIRQAQNAILWAEHIVILYPLWLGDVPALLKAFLEQVLRPGFAIGDMASGMPAKLLKGRSARIVVTMGMPAAAYRLYFRAHSLKSLERNILHFVGINPVRESIIGMVEGKSTTRQKWLTKMEALGKAGR